MKSPDKNKTKELECWEKEFVNEFCDPNDTDLINEYEESWRIKNFISNLLTQQRTEILEEIKKEIKENVEYDEAELGCNWSRDDLLEFITNLLNKKDE